MTKDEQAKRLNNYSKAELIEAILKSKSYELIEAQLFRQKSINIDALVDAAFKDWSKTNKEYIDFLKKLELKYGKGLKTINDNELEKLNQLRKAEAMADEHLQAMYDEQDKLYEKV